MAYDFKLPDGRRFEVQSWGNMAVELAAQLAGVKPVIHCWVHEADSGYVDSLCAAFGLKSLVFERQGDPGSRRLGMMLGPDQAALAEAAEVWASPRSNPGPQLGYPRCCSEAYCAWLDDPSSESGPDVVALIHERTPDPNGKLPFLLNDVYYHYSRRGRAGDAERREALSRLNPGLDLNVLNVVPWHPCHYRCEASLAAARKILSFMKASAPSLASLIERHLARPVVFWDWDRFAALVPAPGGTYTGTHAPFAKLPAETAALLAAGDRLRHVTGGLCVLKGKKELGQLLGARLLDFTS